ncbi:MAG: glycerol-3-phosphate responsive antiterminator [Clostridia bacterium]|nr:glycerol-3-phosphate responsive antiterminator [Clostridia bacterium]
MERQLLFDEIVKSPVIAAVRDGADLEPALLGPPAIIFLLTSSINDMNSQCQLVRQAGKRCFLHVDLISGLRPDSQGLRYVALQAKPDGIITTKPTCVRFAQALGLYTIERLFLLDSAALREGEVNVKSCQPDLVEILPGISEKAIRMAVQAFDRPLIAGGLIRTREDVYAALSAGALGVSTSCQKLWQL